jgi:hypothetical protein
MFEVVFFLKRSCRVEEMDKKSLQTAATRPRRS